MVPTTNSWSTFSELPELLVPLPLVLWVKMAGLIEHFSHFYNISPYCHKLQNFQFLISRALLNNMDSLKVWKSFFCVCFKKFQEKLWSFGIRGTFFLLNLPVSSINESKQCSKYTQCLLQEEGMGILVTMSMSYNRNCRRCWRTSFINSISRTVCWNLWAVPSVVLLAVGGDGCISAGCVTAPESCSAWICCSGCKFAMRKLLLFTSILWSVALPSCFC